MKIFFKIAFSLLVSSICTTSVFAQDMNALVRKVKAKLDQVNDYTADGRMKTDVTFIKAPVGNVKVYYKKPNKFKLKRDGGISILPKGGVSVNMSSVVTTDDFDVIDAGTETIAGLVTKKVKLLPRNDNSDVVLTTMYIHEATLLIYKAVTTTKENGTYEIEMSYGKYSNFGLPDKLVFSFNTKDYKMPKGITMEFDDDDKKAKELKDKMKNKKGKVEIVYTNYSINKGLSDSVFQ
jgi:outer membrane lipoprotein-sorting protein